MRPFYVLSSVMFVAMAGVLWTLASVSPSPDVATVETPSQGWIPTSTPDTRIDYLVSMAETMEPTATETERPERTRIPTLTPIPQCTDQGVTGLCLQWTATPSKTPQPTYTPSPTLGPCGTPDHWGVFPAYCFGD